MVHIEKSKKLSETQEEYIILSNPYVFFRLIVDRKGMRLLTATAPEDSGRLRPFENQRALVEATANEFSVQGLHFLAKADHADRAYLESYVHPDRDHLLQLATSVIGTLGFEDVSVLAMRELLAIHDEFSVGEHGEDAYLSDGVYITSDGRVGGLDG